MARNREASRTEQAFEDEIWRGEDPERMKRFMLARFEDVSLGMKSQGERIDALAGNVERLAAGIEDLAGQVRRMEEQLVALQETTEGRKDEEEFVRLLRQNLASYVLGLLGVMFGVVMVAGVVEALADGGALARADVGLFGLLGALSVGCFVVSILVRRLNIRH